MSEGLILVCLHEAQRLQAQVKVVCSAASRQSLRVRGSAERGRETRDNEGGVSRSERCREGREKEKDNDKEKDTKERHTALKRESAKAARERAEGQREREALETKVRMLERETVMVREQDAADAALAVRC